MLNDIFSAFDDEVMRFKLFKYHHVFNTYIVASPSAALWHTAHKVCCSALQSVEVCLSVLLSKYDYVFRPYIVASQSDPALARCPQGILLLQSVAECCRVLQSVAECCRVLQSVAECCML